MNDITFDFIVVLIPITVLIFAIRRYWRSRQEERLKSKRQKRQEQRIQFIQQARLLGFIFMLIGLGISIGAPVIHDDTPFMARAIMIILGLVIILVANYEARRDALKDSGTVPDFIVDEKGRVRFIK